MSGVNHLHPLEIEVIQQDEKNGVNQVGSEWRGLLQGIDKHGMVNQHADLGDGIDMETALVAFEHLDDANQRCDEQHQ